MQRQGTIGAQACCQPVRCMVLKEAVMASDLSRAAQTRGGDAVRMLR